MAEHNLATLQEQFGYQFKDQAILELALTHKSVGQKSNERLEFLGDAFLNFIVAEILYELFPTMSEGQMTRVRSGMVRQDALVKIAERINLKAHLRVGLAESMQPLPESIVADAFEALIAGVKLDGGNECARRIIHKHMQTLLQNGDAELRKDAKTRLQEILQRQGLKIPSYTLAKKEFGAPLCEVTCTIASQNIQTKGRGATKKIAEQVAAELAIKKLVR